MAIPQQNHEALEHYYTQLENQTRFHCYERNDSVACHQLAEFFETKKKKYLRAMEEFKRNCFENDYGQSCHAYAQLMYHGKEDEVKKDIGESTRAFVKGCNVKKFSGQACDIVGQYLYATENPPEVADVIGPQNMEEAGRMFARGCEVNDQLACSHAAQFYFKLAFKYASQACELNSVVSCVIAADACKNGIGAEKNEQSYEYYNTRAQALKNSGKGKRGTFQKKS